MAIPPTAEPWPQAMDPSEVLEFEVELAGVDGLLEEGEEVDSWSLVLSAEAAALGLTVGTGIRAPSQPTPTSFRFWFSIHSDFHLDPAFTDGGALLPMELTIVTNSTPARTRQRTLVLQVAQQ